MVNALGIKIRRTPDKSTPVLENGRIIVANGSSPYTAMGRVN